MDLQQTTTTTPPAKWSWVTFIFSSHYIWIKLWIKHFGYLTNFGYYIWIEHFGYITLDCYLTFDYSKNISFWIFSLNLTMAEEIKKQLTTMWEKGGIEFNHFESVSQQQCDK